MAHHNGTCLAYASLHTCCATTLQSRLINAIVLILAPPAASAWIYVWRPSFKSHPPDPTPAAVNHSLPTPWRLKEPGGGTTPGCDWNYAAATAMLAMLPCFRAARSVSLSATYHFIPNRTMLQVYPRYGAQ